LEVKFLVDIDPDERTGLFNAVVQRVGCVPQSVIYNLSYFDSAAVRILKKLVGVRTKDKKNSFEMAGVLYEPIHIKADAFFYLSKALGLLFPFVLRRDSKILSQGIGEGNYVLSAHWGVTSGLLAHYIGRRTKKKYVVTYHGSDIHTFSKKRYWLRKPLLRSLSCAEVNIFVSKTLLEEARSLGYDKDNSIVIYNGVDVERFRGDTARGSLQDCGVPDEFFDGSPVVGYVGNMWWVKGADYLPAICNAILSKNPKVKFLFAGDGESLEEIRSSVSKDNIVLLGSVESDVITELMRILDMLIMPSRNEGLPLVLLEALASGVPVVASSVGGVPEVLSSEFLVEPGDDFAGRFADKVVSALERGGDVNVPDGFDWKDIREQERQVYNAL
jgi:glycosyltransferase involved in cell wall biosynthesis